MQIAVAVMLAAALPALAQAPQAGSTLPPTADRVYMGQLRFSEAEEALYLKRFKQQMEGARGTAAEAYDIQEKITGAARWTPLPAAAPGARTVAGDALEAAARYAEANNSSAFIVWRKGKVELERYFGGNDRTTPIISMSLAKPVTAVAIGRAIALGKIKSLDQPIADFVTEWKGDARRERILVRHVLDMRTGFLPQAAALEPGDILNRAYLHPRHDEIIVREYPVVDEPGSRYEYANATSEMVAILIERATGRRYAEFVSKEVWQPLGALGGTVWVNRDGGTAHSGCCMMVPPENFLRLALLVLQDGKWNGRRLLPDGYVKAMLTPTRENPYYGLGVYVAGRYVERRGAANPERKIPGTLHSEPYLAADLALFDGNANQVVYIVPSEQLVILRTGAAPPRTVGKEWDNSMLPNTILRGIVRAKGTATLQPR
jgi:CubicO group peptidase (beta-lactamase class C family)